MSRTAYTLRDLGGRLSWASMAHFVQWLPPGSATSRATNPDVDVWASGDMTAAVVADLIDAVNMLRYEWALGNTPKGRRRPKRPKRYPRPWAKDDDAGGQRYGRDPIPVSQFDAWWESGKS